MITFSYNSIDYAISNPLVGYTTSIILPFEIEQLDNGSYAVWDNGINFDTRRCKCNFLLSVTEANSLLALLTSDSLGRAETLLLKLGTNSGFYPFGADKGDSGNFSIRVLNCIPAASIGHPEDFFPIELEFQNISSYPAYSLPTQISEGSLQIGTIENLRYPSGMHNQDIKYGIKTIGTYGADVYSIDSTEVNDDFNASLSLILSQNKAAALIDHLTSIVRNNALNIIPPENSYLFGRINLSTATYLCQWMDQKIEITYNSFNNFSMNLNFHRIS